MLLDTKRDQCGKMRRLFYYKIREKFITKCVRSFITKCNSVITKCDSYYKMFCLLKNALVQRLIIHTTNTCAVVKLGDEETIAAVKSFADS